MSCLDRESETLWQPHGTACKLMDLQKCMDPLKAAAPSGMIKNKKKHIGDIFHDANDAGVVIHFLELSLTKKNIKQNVSVYYP